MCSGAWDVRKTSKEVWEFDVSLRQGYVTIWAAMAMIRLKYKVL